MERFTIIGSNQLLAMSIEMNFKHQHINPEVTELKSTKLFFPNNWKLQYCIGLLVYLQYWRYKEAILFDQDKA